MWKCILRHESTYVSFAADLANIDVRKFFGLKANCDFFAKKLFSSSYRIRREHFYQPYSRSHGYFHRFVRSLYNCLLIYSSKEKRKRKKNMGIYVVSIATRFFLNTWIHGLRFRVNVTINCNTCDGKASVGTLSDRSPTRKIVYVKKKIKVEEDGEEREKNDTFALWTEKSEASRVTQTHTCSHAFLAVARSRLRHSISDILALKWWKLEKINDSDNIYFR